MWKTCNHCGSYKEWDGFVKSKHAKDWYAPDCKDCRNAYKAYWRAELWGKKWCKEWRKENKDLEKKTEKRFYEKHKEKLRKTALERYYKSRSIKNIIRNIRRRNIVKILINPL